MPILKNAEMWFANLDPKYPNARYNKQNPTWELQLRTTSKEQMDEWKEIGLAPKLMVYKDGDQEGEPILSADGKKQWRVNLRKRSLDSKGEPAKPVVVVNGSLEEIDGATIGNGSIGNIRIYQYEYEQDKETKLASVLMSVQVTKYIKYERQGNPEEQFTMEETEVVEYQKPEETGDTKPKAPSAPKTPKAPEAADDIDEDDAF